MKTIFIKDKHYGWDQPITVQKFELYSDEYGKEYDLTWCNHAGADEVENETSLPRADAPDIVWYDRVLVCNKCNAYKFFDSVEWQDTPYEGVSYV